MSRLSYYTFSLEEYDAKNICISSGSNIAEEIALYQQVIVKRNGCDFLLKIRNGEFEFDDLMRLVEGRMELIKSGV